MVSWSANLARDDRSFAVKIKIEGVGHWLSGPNLAATDGDGRTEFWTAFPQYINGQLSIHRDYLAELPDILSERTDSLGGFPDLGSLTFSILDHSDYLTGILRTERPASTVTDGPIDASDSSIDVRDASGITDTSIIYIGSEAIRVTAVASNTLTVSRGYLGTDAQDHDDLKPVFLSVPFLRGRLADMYLVPLDGTRAEEQHVGSYSIDQISWSQDLNTWTFSAKGLLKYLHRLAPIKQRSARVAFTYGDDSKIPNYGIAVDPTTSTSFVGSLQIWPTEGDDRFYLRNGKEICTVSSTTLANGLTIARRGVIGTEIEDIARGKILYECFVGELGGPCSFRFSPGPTPSESRLSGTWDKTAHWVDIALIIMTSSADSADGLELLNYDADEGNYSSLPPGYGLGLPHTKIDWTSWKAVKARTRQYEFPNFVYPLEGGPVSFAELLNTHFLKPIGAFITIENGTAKIVLPRKPLAEEAVIELGEEEILTKKVGKAQFLPRLSISQNIGRHSGRILYRIGREAWPLSVSSEDFFGTFGQRGYYANDDKPIEIDVPSSRPEDSALWYRAAERRLYRWHSPNYEIDVDVDMGLFDDLTVGSICNVKLDELPDMNAGTRAWTDNVAAEVLEREPKLDRTDGAYLKLKLLAYGGVSRGGRIAPSAFVLSVIDEEATCVENLFTHADAPDDLPTQDVLGFAVDDVVKLVDVNGVVLASGATETVTSVDDVANVLRLSGDFGGVLAADVIIVYAGRDDEIGQQYTSRVSFADKGTQTVGASNQTAWVWSEP